MKTKKKKRPTASDVVSQAIKIHGYNTYLEKETARLIELVRDYYRPNWKMLNRGLR